MPDPISSGAYGFIGKCKERDQKALHVGETWLEQGAPRSPFASRGMVGCGPDPQLADCFVLDV